MLSTYNYMRKLHQDKKDWQSGIGVWCIMQCQSTAGSDHQEMESSMQAASSRDSHMEADQGKLIMDEELWKDFPPDLHVEILGSFSIIELCRFRTISPAWDELAENLVSGAWNDIMAQLKARPQATYMFRTPTTLDLGFNSAENLVSPSWEVYDPNTRQCFPLNMQFLNTKDEFGRLCRFKDGCTTIAADKGFICVVPDHDSEYIKVVNPMTGCVVELPPVWSVNEITDYYSRVVSLVVADDYLSFALYVVQDRVHDTPMTKRFDSNVGAWQELPQPPATLSPSHILHMESTLFTLFWDEGDDSLVLLGFDTTRRSMWRDMGVEIPQGAQLSQLATALGRLFLVAVLEDKIELMEVDVTTTSCTLVASMDRSHEFYKERKWMDDWMDHGDEGLFQTVVVGCGNFIVFSSVSGASVAYDLEKSKWCEWIQSTKYVSDVDCYKRGLYGTSMSLTLNPVPAVHTVSI